MTEEIKNEVKCDCKEKAIAQLKKFALITGAVFVGTTLSILLCANILKPKCPMAPMGPIPGIHRQLPPPMMHGDFDREMHKKDRGDCPCRNFKKHHKGMFKGPKGPHHWDKKPPIEHQKTAPDKQ